MDKLITKLGTQIAISDKTKRIKKLWEIAKPLSSQHIRQAALKLDESDEYMSAFKDSTGFDVIIGSKKYPPKAILGRALSDYYGVEFLPEHFVGGEGSSCFRILKNLRFEIVGKNKTKREYEFFDYSSFVVGEEYTKLKAFEKAGVWVPNHARDIPGPTRFNNCVVLFVTLEKDHKELAHKYNDKFILNGKMFQWESQNKNTEETPHIKKIINCDPVVLFARVHEKIKSKSQPFIYVGQLQYVKHNNTVDRKNVPIEVIFDVLEYQSSASDKLVSLYEWVPGITTEQEVIDISEIALNKTNPPEASNKTNGRGKNNRKVKINWAERDEKNRSLGLMGEKLVLQYEIQKLTELGLTHLAERVTHTAENSDSDGYDILSFDEQGIEKYIEVKTTRQSKHSPFFISRNEVKFSKAQGLQYWIYRVYNFNEKKNEADFYTIQGSVEKHFNLIPENYKAAPK
ncbi:DUF3427 domain-containing protein [Providencia sp. SP181]|uniref:DUF3427 domain-containing protein n=1 Tax=Providencia sp. SP181 TaxID=3136277 RepID=UPI003D2D70E9